MAEPDWARYARALRVAALLGGEQTQPEYEEEMPVTPSEQAHTPESSASRPAPPPGRPSAPLPAPPPEGRPLFDVSGLIDRTPHPNEFLSALYWQQFVTRHGIDNAIRAIVGTFELPPDLGTAYFVWPADFDVAFNPDWQGAFLPDVNEIAVQPGLAPGSTALHEVGHWLDENLGISGPGAVREVLSSSPTIRYARDMLEPRGGPGMSRLLRPYYLYALQPEEQFARAFTAYVSDKFFGELPFDALPPGDAPVDPWLRWQASEYGPIFEAFDDYFSDLLKPDTDPLRMEVTGGVG